MTEEQDLYIQIGQSLNGAKESQMFGKPCFKTKKKAFICFFKNEMVFKLTGDLHNEAMSFDGSQLFDPSGKKRPMKEWVQVPYDYKENWKKFAIGAMNYVNSKVKASS